MPKPDFSDVPDPKKLDQPKEVEPKFDDMEVPQLPPLPPDQQTSRTRQISQSEAFGDGFEFNVDDGDKPDQPSEKSVHEADQFVADNAPSAPQSENDPVRIQSEILEELRGIRETIDAVSVALLERKRGLG